MQYQVYKEDTGELIAWIDTETSKQVLKNGYGIAVGEDLKVFESEEAPCREGLMEDGKTQAEKRGCSYA